MGQRNFGSLLGIGNLIAGLGAALGVSGEQRGILRAPTQVPDTQRPQQWQQQRYHHGR